MTGFKIWTAEFVASDELQELIQEQVVATFADDAERVTELDTPVVTNIEGQMTVLRDVDRLYIGDGTGHVEAGSYGAWHSDHAPTLDATTTAPTIGTGPDLFARYYLAGSLAIVHLRVAFGTGAAAGTGTYEVDLPPAVVAAADLHASRELVVGTGLAFDSSAGIYRAVAAKVVAGGTLRFIVDGETSEVTDAVPWIWNDDDVVFDGTLTLWRTP